MASPLRILELYSGIGGMHFALKESGILYHIVKAMDINNNTNKVYKHNFPETPISNSSICTLQVEDLDELKIDMMLMSPPCQPFTRMGNQKDEEDARTGSFLHFLSLFKKLTKPPSYLLVENVKGFESSKTRDQLVDTMTECGYNYQEMLLTPKQFGVPNSRLRYYLLAKLKPLKFGFENSEEIMKSLPDFPKKWLKFRVEAEEKLPTIDPQEVTTCVCQGQFGDKTDGDIKQLKRPSDDLDNSNVKRFKQDFCDSEKKETYSGDTLKSLSKENSKSTALCYSGGGVCAGKSLSSSGHNSEGDHNEQITTEKNAIDSVPLNCLQHYGTRLRLPYEERDSTDGICLKVRNFLESDWRNTEKFVKYLLPEKCFKFLVNMDIVNPCSRKTNCFTKKYSQFVTGGGSFLLMTTDINAIEAANNLKEEVMEKNNRDTWGKQEMEIIRKLQIRYYTPQEVANIMCFPQSFDFPDGFTDKQKYMMLGNSINIHVVSILIKLLTM